MRAARATHAPTPDPRPRKRPADLSVRLAEQARSAHGELLRHTDDRRALLLVLRLVFLLHAEAHDLTPTFLTPLLHRLRDDPAAQHRHTAWPSLADHLTRVFTVDPTTHHGPLFAPSLANPRIPDATLLRVLDLLLLLDDAELPHDTPDTEQFGHIYEALQPGDARRRSGSHYTPRALTTPIVETTLRPVLAALGDHPTPARILSLKICDPATGSGAFLLEACRQLGDLLLRAWATHRAPPELPPHTTPRDHARLLVATHCLHGVDLDPLAVDLARLSLWLISRAKDHPLTFFSPLIKTGDSLLDVPNYPHSHDAEFSAFSWPRDFPRVFTRDNPGFDCILGNPPFLGGTRISSALSREYLARLTAAFPGAGNRTDLVAYFFRRSFDLLRDGGTLGLIGTNTLAQGDTRSAGLAHLCSRGATIYAATRRLPWPGAAAVVASVVHIIKNSPHTTAPAILDGAPVPAISAFLVPGPTDRDPTPLAENNDLVFTGFKPYADGLIFSDNNAKTTPLAEMHRLLARDPRNHDLIHPYLGGDEVNRHPRQSPHRHIINFSTMTEQEAARWPDLLAIAKQKVLPDRLRKTSSAVAAWPYWQFWRPRPELAARLRQVDRVLVNSQVSVHHALAFQPSNRIFSHALNVFILPGHAAFAVLQSRIHELWARRFGSSMKDDLRYTPSDCFNNFPLPLGWTTNPDLESSGQLYNDHRAALMVHHDHGLTITYHRFHDPDEHDPQLLKLRELHAGLDRAVLLAYGWSDLAARATCEFRLDHDPGPRARKKPWRLRWPQAFADEVLARLLALNRQRADAERRPA